MNSAQFQNFVVAELFRIHTLLKPLRDLKEEPELGLLWDKCVSRIHLHPLATELVNIVMLGTLMWFG